MKFLPPLPVFSTNFYKVAALSLIVTVSGLILLSRRRSLTRQQRIGCWLLIYNMVCVAGLFWFYLGMMFDFSLSMSTEGMSSNQLRPWWVLICLLRLGEWIGLPLTWILFLIGAIAWLLNKRSSAYLFQIGFWLCYLHLLVVTASIVLWVLTIGPVTFPSQAPMFCLYYLSPTVVGYMATRVFNRKVKQIQTSYVPS